MVKPKDYMHSKWNQATQPRDSYLIGPDCTHLMAKSTSLSLRGFCTFFPLGWKSGVRGKTAQDANPVNRGDSLQPSVGSVSGFLEAAELRNGDFESSWLLVSYF